MLRTLLPFILISLFTGSIRAQEAWRDSLAKFRTVRAAELEESASLSAKKPATTAFFNPESSFRIPATIHLYKNPRMLSLKTNDGTDQPYIKKGFLNLELNGNTLTLYVYQNPEIAIKEGMEDYLFLPFNDSTNTSLTFAGGRYLQLRIPEGNTVLVDFNFSEQPLCAWSSKFSCPLPPEENRIPAMIHAGERYPEALKNGKK